MSGRLVDRLVAKLDADHRHVFRQYRDGRPPHCTCGAWLRTEVTVVTDEPLPDPGWCDRKRAGS